MQEYFWELPLDLLHAGKRIKITTKIRVTDLPIE
jgi:hypothetical protein